MAGYDGICIGKIGNSKKNCVFKRCGQRCGPILCYSFRKDRTLDTIIEYTLTAKENIDGFTLARFNGKNNMLFACHGGNRPFSAVTMWKKGNNFPDSSISVSDIPQSMRSADLDGDGKEEVIVAHGGWNTISVISSSGGIRTFGIPCMNNMQPDGLQVADINSDGKPDIILVDYISRMSVLINTTP